MTFDEMMRFVTPGVSDDWVCYEDDPLAYLVAGAIAANSEQQINARDWYLRRITELAGPVPGVEVQRD